MRQWLVRAVGSGVLTGLLLGGTPGVAAAIELPDDAPTPAGAPWRGSLVQHFDISWSSNWGTDAMALHIDYDAPANSWITYGGYNCTVEEWQRATTTTGTGGTFERPDDSPASFVTNTPAWIEYTYEESCAGTYKYFPDANKDSYVECPLSFYGSATDQRALDEFLVRGNVDEYGEDWVFGGYFEDDDAAALDPGYTITNDPCGLATYEVTQEYLDWEGDAPTVSAGFQHTQFGLSPAPSDVTRGTRLLQHVQSPMGMDNYEFWFDLTYVGIPGDGFDDVTAPDAPLIGTASSGKAGRPINATTRWSAPADDGGSPITAYKVQAQKLNSSGGVVKRFNATRVATARTLTMVLPRGRYKFRVAAVNSKGTSAWSTNSNIATAR